MYIHIYNRKINGYSNKKYCKCLQKCSIRTTKQQNAHINSITNLFS